MMTNEYDTALSRIKISKKALSPNIDDNIIRAYIGEMMKMTSSIDSQPTRNDGAPLAHS